VSSSSPPAPTFLPRDSICPARDAICPAIKGDMTICPQCQMINFQRLIPYGHPQKATESYGKPRKGTERYGKVRKPFFFDFKMSEYQRFRISAFHFLLSALSPAHLKPTGTHLISHLKHTWHAHFTGQFTLVHLFGVCPLPRLPAQPRVTKFSNKVRTLSVFRGSFKPIQTY
jgi:hypothetical protein